MSFYWFFQGIDFYLVIGSQDENIGYQINKYIKKHVSILQWKIFFVNWLITTVTSLSISSTFFRAAQGHLWNVSLPETLDWIVWGSSDSINVFGHKRDKTRFKRSAITGPVFRLRLITKDNLCRHHDPLKLEDLCKLDTRTRNRW